MAFSARHLVAAGTMAGALVVGGATWAAAQDSPSTTDGDSTTTTTAQDHRYDDGNRSEDNAPRAGQGCRHGEDGSGGDSSSGNSSGDSSGDANAETSGFWS
jgi:hypothetical protein